MCAKISAGWLVLANAGLAGGTVDAPGIYGDTTLRRLYVDELSMDSGYQPQLSLARYFYLHP